MKRDKKIEITVAAICTIIASVIAVLVDHAFDNSPRHIDDEEQLLSAAEDYFKIGDTVKATEIYQKLETNPIALNNMAFFYATGEYGFEQNIDKAKELYEKAYKLDSEFVSQYIDINLLYPEDVEETIDLLELGCESKDEATASFLTKIIRKEYPEYEETASDFFLQQEKQWKIDFMTQNIEYVQEWEFNNERLEKGEGNDFYRAIELYSRRERVGTYDTVKEENGKKYFESVPVSATVHYVLIKKGEYEYSNVFEESITFDYL